MLHEMLTGEAPPRGGASLRRPSARTDGISARLDDVIVRLLAADPDERHGSADDVLKDLDACLAEPGRATPPARTPGRGSGPDDAPERPVAARLLEALRVLSRQIMPDDVGATLVRLGVDLAGASGGTLILVDADEPLRAASAGVAFDRPAPALTEAVQAAARDAGASGRTIRAGSGPAVLGVPLIDEGALAGVLCLVMDDEARALDPGLIRDAEALAAQGAVSLAAARRHQALARREALLSEGERLSRVGSWSLDLASGRLAWSAEHYRILGLEPDPATPPQLDWFIEKVHPDDRWHSQDRFAEAARRREVFELVFRIVASDGQVKHVHSIGRPVLDPSGQVSGYVGMLMDVTGRKLAEDRLQQAQAELAHVNRIALLGELVASIAHEVSQPIGAGVTNCDAALRWLQREEPDLVEVENAIRRAVQNGRRAGEVVARLRALVRNSPPELRPLDLNEVVHQALPVIQQELSRREVTLELGLTPGELPIAGDMIQLQQVMINLVVNGAQAMEQVRDRRRVVTLTTRAGERDDIRLVVRDTGPGIDEHTRDRLFHSFFTTKPNGMGIGLSICRSIVETHGGTIAARSADGGGAIFEVRLPLRRDPAIRADAVGA
jgi:PAS domain S-box-containing protein